MFFIYLCSLSAWHCWKQASIWFCCFAVQWNRQKKRNWPLRWQAACSFSRGSWTPWRWTRPGWSRFSRPCSRNDGVHAGGLRRNPRRCTCCEPWSGDQRITLSNMLDFWGLARLASLAANGWGTIFAQALQHWNQRSKWKTVILQLYEYRNRKPK